MKNTLVLGATPNTDRYAYIASEMLLSKGHPIFPVEIKKGLIQGHEIQNNKTILPDIHTISFLIFSHYISINKVNNIIDIRTCRKNFGNTYFFQNDYVFFENISTDK